MGSLDEPQPYNSSSVLRTNEAAASERGRIEHRNGFTYLPVSPDTEPSG